MANNTSLLACWPVVYALCSLCLIYVMLVSWLARWWFLGVHLLWLAVNLRVLDLDNLERWIADRHRFHRAKVE